VIGILVAVAVPLWLVVEQILKWRALGPRRTPSATLTVAGRLSNAAKRDGLRDVTRPALHRKAS
jgi:hypothetical protein